MNPKADEFQIGVTPSGKCGLSLSPYEFILWFMINESTICQFPVPSCILLWLQKPWCKLLPTRPEEQQLLWARHGCEAPVNGRRSKQRDPELCVYWWAKRTKTVKTLKVLNSKWMFFNSETSKSKFEQLCQKRYLLSSWVEVMCEFYQATIASWNCPAWWSWIAKCQFALGSAHLHPLKPF